MYTQLQNTQPKRWQQCCLILTLFLLTCSNFITANAQTTYPTLLRYAKPSPEPAAPGDAFTPPMSGTASTSAPQAAEWTRTAGPDESIVLTGINFSRYSGTDAGKDTRFLIYGKNGTQKDARIQRLDGDKAILTLPKDLPSWSMYLVWPGNEAGYGTPFAVNKTDAWWAGPDKAVREQTVSVFGRNLAQNNDTLRSYVYLKPVGGAGQWVNVTDVNPFRVDFTVPAGLANGEYEIWTHNGHGGQYGWSGPQKLTIYDGPEWTSTVFNVKNFGASGNGYNNDTDAIRKAINAARRSPGATIYFPAGTYMVSNYLHIYDNVKWKGDGKNNTILKCAPNFNSEYGMVFGNVAKTFSISDMGFDTNNNFRGNRDKPVILRDCEDVWINNVRFNFKGFNLLDLHSSHRVFITNTDHIGNTTFLGNCSQLFIDRNNFYMTNDSEMALHTWGGAGISMTRSTCRDLDNSNLASGAGWGKGRFFVGNGSWGSNHLTYLANNITYDLTPRPAGDVDQNSGEQFLWEGNLGQWAGYPSSSSATSTSLSGFSGTTGIRYVAIVKGRGLGQTRRIITSNGGTITMDEPWNVIPDASSYMVVGDFADRIAIYKNSFDGKPRAATSATHIAAAAVEPFGGTFNLIADNNVMNELRQGIANWSTQHTTGMDPNFFNLYSNNTMRNVRWGMYNEVGRFARNEGTFMLGVTYRNNTVESAVMSGFYNSLPSVNEVLNASVYEHNSINNTLEGMITGKVGAANLLFYQNDFNGVGKAIPTTTKMALRDNTYQGVSKNYDGLLPGAIIEAPLHVVEMAGKAGSSVVKTNFVLLNSGYTAMNWAATSSTTWLTLSANGGTIEDERGLSLIELNANPAGLPIGTHKATITVTTGALTQKYTVLLNLTTPNDGVTISAPTANATFSAAEPIIISATAADANSPITKVEFFAGTTKLGEDLSSPYSFTWNNAAAGTYSLTAKATNGAGQVTTSNAVSITKTGNTEPIVAITSPAASANFAAPAMITIDANASDTDGTITKVEFFNGNNKIGEDTTSPYSFNWYNVAIGTYAITAKATDNGGTTSTSVPVNVTSLTATSPRIAIVSPGDNSNINAPTNILIVADADLTNGEISKVEFFAGGLKIGERGHAPFEMYWMNVLAGTYSLTARATGSNGSVTTSAPVKLNVVSFGTPIAGSPTVSISSPTSSSNFKAPAGINITANATAAKGSISKVEYFYGTTKLGEGTTAPYTLTWNNVIAGTYNITAKATDIAGITTTSAPVMVTVGSSNSTNNAVPTVNITSPTASTGFLAPATVAITANAIDADGTVSKVEFYQGTTKIGEDTSSPYSFNWSNVTAGTFAITARAIDNSGLASTSSPVIISVQSAVSAPAPTPPAPTAPIVAITAPTASSSFTAPGNIIIEANASDADGTVSKVEFYNGTAKLGEDLSSPYNFTWSNVNAGTYTITAKAFDNSGLTNVSDPFSAEVSPAVTTAPTPTPPQNAGGVNVALTAPTTNTTLVIPTNLYLAANATSNDGAIVRVEFYNGTTKLGEKTWAPYEIYVINAAAGNYNITAKLYTTSGATAVSAPVAVAIVKQDGTTSVTPAINVAPTVAITAPTASSSFTAPGNIIIEANVSDADGTVSKVEFYNGTAKLGEDLSSPYNFTWSNVNAGTYTITAKAFDDAGLSTNSAAVNISVTSVIAPPTTSACTGTGSISWDYWANVPPWHSISQIPTNNSPAGSKRMTSFSSPENIGDLYGARLRGYICPPVSGNYVFYIAGDDQADLFLSTDEKPENKTFIAYLSSSTASNQYTKDASQQSKTIYLQAGKRYYIEAMHKEGAGNDYVNVAWKLPNGTMQAPIAGAHLMPYESSSSLLSARKPGTGEDLLAPADVSKDLNAYPNPFTASTTIEFSLPQDEAYTLNIYDMRGSLIQMLQEGKAKANQMVQVTWESGNLPQGIYIARLITKSGIQNVKMVLQ